MCLTHLDYHTKLAAVDFLGRIPSILESTAKVTSFRESLYIPSLLSREVQLVSDPGQDLEVFGVVLRVRGWVTEIPAGKRKEVSASNMEKALQSFTRIRSSSFGPTLAVSVSGCWRGQSKTLPNKA